MNSTGNIFLPQRASSGARKQAPAGLGKPNQNAPVWKKYANNFARAVGQMATILKPVEGPSYSKGTPAAPTQQAAKQKSRSQAQVSSGAKSKPPARTGVGHRFSTRQEFSDYVGKIWLANKGADSKQIFRRDEDGETCTLNVPGRETEVWRSDNGRKTWHREE